MASCRLQNYPKIWIKYELGFIYQYCGIAHSKQVDHVYYFTKNCQLSEKTLILRFDFNCVQGIIWIYYARKKKPKH